MNILAIETSSPACSVALSIDDSITEKHIVLNNQHSEYLLKFIAELIHNSAISKTDLQAIAVGNGPGSFTGLRLGMGVAQGLSYGLNAPLIPVSSLLNVAAQSDQDYLLVALDARMAEVYWQCFQRQDYLSFTALTSTELSRPSELTLPRIKSTWFGLGSGWDQYLDQLQVYLDNEGDYLETVMPKASVTARLAQKILEEGGYELKKQILPSYVRNKVTN